MKTNNDKVYIVTRVYISTSADNANNCHDCEAFYDKDKARQLFDKWRKEELELRQETGCDYEVSTYNEQTFSCSWDNNSEMLILVLTEKTIRTQQKDATRQKRDL